jgi:hypothetical protein
LFLTSSTSVAVPYTVVISNPVYTSILNFWNWYASYTGTGVITGTVSVNWGFLGPGQPAINVGGSVIGTTLNLRPTSVKINGVSCTVV